MNQVSTHAVEPSRDDAGRLVIREHAQVVALALDPSTFSNATSRHLQVPNGLDGQGHAAWRERLDPFFAHDRMVQLEQSLRPVVEAVVADLVASGEFDAVADLGSLVAVRCMTSWLGWSKVHEADLVAWVADNRACSRSGNRLALRSNARRFDDLIALEIAAHRAQGVCGGDSNADPTDDLIALTNPGGEPISDAEIVSILRNWTGGDLSSLALCVGVVVQWIVSNPDHQRYLRAASDAHPGAVIDEILRLDDPFVTNRPRATGTTEVAGCPVQAGAEVVLHWRDANLDPRAFADPEVFDPEGHAAANLVYGIGAHVCPGRELATLQLRLVVRALLNAGSPTPGGQQSIREEAPVAGYRSVSVIIESHPVSQQPRQ